MTKAQARFYTPGFWSLVFHVLALAVLMLLVIPVTLLRMIVAPVAEWLIGASDGLHDALVERLEL